MRRPEPTALDLTRWPGVDAKALTREVRERYVKRARAVELYVRGRPVQEIEAKVGLDRRTLYRSLERALKAHPDGRPWGYRALIPQMRIKAYERIKGPASRVRGLAGAFGQLLGRHRPLERLVREVIQDKTVRLVDRGDKVYLVGLKAAHRRFVAACRALGLSARDYPLNHDAKALGALARTLRAQVQADFGEATRAAGAVRVKPSAALAFAPQSPVTEPFDTVEFDAHKLDVRLKILDHDPFGDEHVLEIERVWLLALLDVATRAILGYTLCLKREYSRFDVIRTFERALAPAQPPAVTIPGVVPIKSGGFVSHALPETAYACWRQIRFDNARAHLAADSLEVACELLGCTVDVGPLYAPDDRPFIERFFGTVASQFSHRLPGSTGAHPRDLVRRLTVRSADLELVVSLDELEELLAVWVWNYNGTPHRGLGGRTPLEVMQAAIRERGSGLRQLPGALRTNLCLLQTPHRARVRGSVSRGEKPHVSFYHVRYSSPALAKSAELIGKELRLYYDVEDIRVLRAYRSDGTELGELRAEGLWRLTPHSLDTRIRVFRARRLRELRFAEHEDPIQAYLAWKRSRAKRSRKDASEIAQIKARMKAGQGPAGEAPHEAEAEPVTEPRLPLATGPVKAKRMRIPPGFAQ